VRLAYPVAEAAELCGISERQMRRLISEGVIHAANMGDLRVGHCELERYLLGIPRVATTVSETVATPDAVAVRRSPSRPVRRGEKAHA
jgi:excisionase family DNA binding protein